MEELVNSNIIIDIEIINNIPGGDQYFEVLVTNKNKEKYKITFDPVWDLRYSIENGYIDRFSKFKRNAKEYSSVLIVENSKYLKYFEHQVSGTRPTDELKNYIISDEIDTVIEILTIREPVLEKVIY